MRVGQVMWVLNHLADLESDLSRFHRVDDLYELDGPKFFRLVWRLSSYGGVIAMRLQQQRSEQPPVPAPAPLAVRRQQPVRSDGSRPLAAFAAQFPDIIEKRRAV